MRPAGIVFDAVIFDHDPGFGERPELFAVEVLIPESAVETLDEGPVEKPGISRCRQAPLPCVRRKKQLGASGREARMS